MNATLRLTAVALLTGCFGQPKDSATDSGTTWTGPTSGHVETGRLGLFNDTIQAMNHAYYCRTDNHEGCKALVSSRLGPGDMTTIDVAPGKYYLVAVAVDDSCVASTTVTLNAGAEKVFKPTEYYGSMDWDRMACRNH